MSAIAYGLTVSTKPPFPIPRHQATRERRQRNDVTLSNSYTHRT